MKHEVSTSNSSACAVALRRTDYNIYCPQFILDYQQRVFSPLLNSLLFNSPYYSFEYSHGGNLLHGYFSPHKYGLRL